jgi:hypothetical protein
MEIHRPKAVHSVREFLKEYAIVVLGVLTALALESGLLALRDARQADEARAGIRGEIAHDLGLLDTHAAFEPCVIRRFAEIENLIDHPPAPGAPIWIGHPLNYPTVDAAYHTAQNSGRLALLPAGEQANYATIYTDFAHFNEALAREHLALADLRTLEKHPALTPEVAWRLRDALAQARIDHWMEEIGAANARLIAKRLDVADGPRQVFKTQSICVPIDTPRDEALKQVVAGRGAHLVYDEP